MIEKLRRFLLDRMVLRSTRHSIDFSPQQRELLRWRGRPLECFVQRNFDDDHAPTLLVLKFPGTAGRAERSTSFPMSMLGDQRAEIWTWNPPGYGGSGGGASLAGMADAAVEFWNQVRARHGDDISRVWLCGNSLGSVAALHVAASVQPDPRCSGMILRNPPPLLAVVRRIALQYPLGSWMDRVIHSLNDSMNAMVTAPQVNLPAVFLQSECDTLVPPEDQRRLIEVYAGPLRVVLLEGLEHAGITTELHQPLIQESIEWLWQQSESKMDEPTNAK